MVQPVANERNCCTLNGPFAILMMKGSDPVCACGPIHHCPVNSLMLNTQLCSLFTGTISSVVSSLLTLGASHGGNLQVPVFLLRVQCLQPRDQCGLKRTILDKSASRDGIKGPCRANPAGASNLYTHKCFQMWSEVARIEPKCFKIWSQGGG